MMLLSRFWYVVLSIVMAGALYVAFLAVGQYNRRNLVAMNEELASDSQVVGWQLQIDARRRLDALLVGAVDKGVQDALVSANGKDPVPRGSKDAAKRALNAVADKLPADYKEDALFAVDRDGRVVGEYGYDAATEDMELGGYPAVFDALHGYLRDDTWVLGGKMYRVVARPVEFDVSQPPAGAIVGLRAVDPTYAKDVAHRTRTNVAFYVSGQTVASASQDGFDTTAMSQIATPLAGLTSDKAYTDTGHSEVHPLSDTTGAMYGRLYGDAWDLGAGYAVARGRVSVAGPMGFITGADDKDKANVNWALLGGLLLLGAAAGIVFTVLEHSMPLKEAVRQAAALKRGEIDFFQVPRIRGPLRVLAQDVNAGIERVVEKGGGAARRPADLEQILGPAPAQPAMSAFALPGAGQDGGSQPGVVPPQQPSRPGPGRRRSGARPMPPLRPPREPLRPPPAPRAPVGPRRRPSPFNVPTPMAQAGRSRSAHRRTPAPRGAPRRRPAPKMAITGARPVAAPPPPPPPSSNDEAGGRGGDDGRRHPRRGPRRRHGRAQGVRGHDGVAERLRGLHSHEEAVRGADRRPHLREVPAHAQEEPRRAHRAPSLQARPLLGLCEGGAGFAQGDAREGVTMQTSMLGQARHTRRALGLGVALATFFGAGAASATTVLELGDNGSEQMGRGGAWVARASDPLAAFYNPAGLAGQDTRLILDVNFNIQNTCFTRTKALNDTTSDGVTAGGAYPQVCNDGAPFPDPTIAFAYKVNSRLGLGLAILGPSAAGTQTWPDTGPQRYLLTSANTLLLTPTIGVGWEPIDRLRVGASFIWGVATLDFTNYSWGANVNGATPAANDVKGELKVVDVFIPGFTLGTIWSPTDQIDIAGWYKFMSSIDAKGSVNTTYGTGANAKFGDTTETNCGVPGGKPLCAPNDAEVKINIPMEAKIGFRFHKPRAGVEQAHRRDPMSQDVFDIEGDLTWANNSALQTLNINFPAGIPVYGTPGSLPQDAGVPHNFQDVWGARLGGDYNVLPDQLAIRAGAYFQTAAQPAQYQNIDFVGQQEVGIAAGGTYRIHLGSAPKKNAFEISLGIGHTFIANSTNNTQRASRGSRARRATRATETASPPRGATARTEASSTARSGP